MTADVRRSGAVAAPRRVCAPLVALLALAGCHKAPPIIVPPPPTSIRIAQLQRTIDEILSDPALARASWGIAVKSLARADMLYDRNAGKLLTPASSMKVVTLAVAAERLGWDFNFRTRVLQSGIVEGDVLKGDLVVIGSGDPTIENWRGNPWLEGWADLLTRQGIRTIAGRLIGDDDVFDDDGLGTGWMWDDLAASYSAPVAGLQFNQNAAQLTITPGSSADDLPLVVTTPSWAPVAFLNLATTTAGGPATLAIRPSARSSLVEIQGAVPIGSPGVTRNIAVTNPTSYFLAAARSALTSGGVSILGPAMDLDEIVSPPDMTAATLLTDYTSSLSSVATPMMKLSPNLFAETLVKTLGAQVQGTGTADAGRGIVKAALTAWGVGVDDVVMVDGSGLSRYNLVTPAAMVAVLAHVFNNERIRDRFIDALPSAGVDGTLADRMKGTAAAANLRAKTGSFSNARALVGYVKTKENEQLAFAVIANNYNADASMIDRATDAIAVALAEFSRR